MEGNLVIVESPAKAKTIQKFLGEGFTVRSSFGHIRDLQEKSLSIDVAAGFRPEYVIPDNKKKLVSGLIIQAARLKASLDALWLDIQANGEYEDFQNAKDLTVITRERASSKTFTARDKSYQAIMKQLMEHLPHESNGPSKLDELLRGE